MTERATSTTWMIVVSRDHARRGLGEGFIMANHGKQAPLARMAPGDGLLIYSPKTDYPTGDPLKAITIVGTITGTEPEPSEVIPGGFRLAAQLSEIEPVPLAKIRDHIPMSKLRFGAFELPTEDAEAIWGMVE